MNFKLTRFAPTPSGFLHLGNIYSFLVTKVLAEIEQSKILLRIDDLDRDRYRDEYVQDIFDSLDFMELSYDQGPRNLSEFKSEWSQIHRMRKYESALEKLRELNVVFACDCSRKKIQEMDSSGYYLGHCQDRRIPLDRKDMAWRFNAFETDFVTMKSYPDQKEKTYTLPQDIAFFILRKKDRLPAYQLTSLIDDIHFGVDLIVRGKDLHSSSLAQLALADKLSSQAFLESTFYHHRILKGKNNKKLSKSEDALSVRSLRKEGKKAKDIFHLIGILLENDRINSYETFKNQLLEDLK